MPPLPEVSPQPARATGRPAAVRPESCAAASRTGGAATRPLRISTAASPLAVCEFQPGYTTIRETRVRWPAASERRVRPVMTSIAPADVSSTQCAAVRTADGPMTLPPQNWPPAGEAPCVTSAAM